MVCTFGELLLRFSPAMNRQWIREARIPVYVGGAELNVAAALASWQIPVRYCTRLPDHALSGEIIAGLVEQGIDASIIPGGERIGTYYLPQGTDLKQGGVIYDRAYSAFWQLQTGMIDWNSVLNGCKLFHWSAISPALNRQVADVCLEALQAARNHGLPVSVDLNYRASLWQYGKQPVEVMPELVQYSDVVMGNLWAAEQLLGIPSPVKSSAGKSRDELTTAAAESMDLLQKEYSQVKTVAYTFRLEQSYFAVLRHQGQTVGSREFDLDYVADKVGSGDCFMAGLLYGIYQQHMPQQIIDFAAAAAVGKMGEVGDATRQSVQDILNRLAV